MCVGIDVPIALLAKGRHLSEPTALDRAAPRLGTGAAEGDDRFAGGASGDDILNFLYFCVDYVDPDGVQDFFFFFFFFWLTIF